MNIATYARLKKLREEMKNANIRFFYVANNDPHMSEYLPAHWCFIEWLTGFSGEAATLVVSETEACVWTDSRFFISGEKELKGSPFKLMKSGMKDVPDVERWLMDRRIDSETNEWQTVGVIEEITPDQTCRNLTPTCPFNPIDRIWDQRPTQPDGMMERYAEEYAGKQAAEKIAQLMDDITPTANAILLSQLDDIAWLLNLRGNDVACTPVTIAYALMSQTGHTLFVDTRKVTDEVQSYLQTLQVSIKPYESLYEILEQLGPDQKVQVDKARTNAAVVSALKRSAARCYDHPSPIALRRAIKNPTEIAGTRNAMLKDGIALTEFFCWLEQKTEGEQTLTMGDGAFYIDNEVTEMECAQQLVRCRQKQALYRDESFPAIVAWKEHAAMPHYMATPESNVCITGNGLLLIDTGAQYLDGTTDITRTIGIGSLTDAMKRDYTLVLKGHIRLARAFFPQGTTGCQLDVLARMDLWHDGKNYLHGTGHGVGHYLGVHEGPQSIRMQYNPQPLMPGMITSNEPAVYLKGEYGIRHENCVMVLPVETDSDCPDSTPCRQNEMGEYLKFETMSLCYIDTRPIDPNLLDNEEKNWLNNYQRHVFETLAPHLDETIREWLRAKTQPI